MAKEETFVKKYWKTILLFAVFIGLLIFVVYTYRNEPKEKSKIIFQTDKSKITSVKLISSKEFEIKKLQKGYGLFIPEEVPAIQNRLLDIVNAASKVEYDTIIVQKAVNYNEFGLGQPNTVVVINVGNGSRKVLYIGDKTPTEDGYYAKQEGQSTIYKISLSTGEKFTQPIDNLIDKKIFIFDKEKIDKIVLNYNNFSKIFIKENGVWENGNKQLKQEKANELLDRLSNIEVEGLVSKDQYVKGNRKPYVELVIYEANNEVLNISLIKVNEKYNVIKKGVQVQYYVEEYTFDKIKNDMLRVYQEAIEQT